ncbi:MAG: hypothetical protein PW792_00455 [Acidobacteriaceae bacterium]|nr:hypothetical protein [Acidobacteriaceae bacterium]
MPPPRVPSAESTVTTPASIAAIVQAFLEQHEEAALLEEGKVLFQLPDATITAKEEHGRCTLQAWNAERNLARAIVSVEERAGRLRLASARLGREGTKLLELTARVERKAPTARASVRTKYAAKLERVLQREFAPAKSDGFRSAMDLERSFGPGYARGWMSEGTQAWAVVGVGESESISTVDGVLTVGILWLQHCREQLAGKRSYRGLRVIVPRGAGQLTQTRMAWLNQAAEWELWELDEASETLTPLDPEDVGNVAMRLIHRPDEIRARERFADAIETVKSLLPAGENQRVEEHLRSSTELAFLLHGLEFARARVRVAAQGFSHAVELSFGAGAEETVLSEATRAKIAELVADLFARRRAAPSQADFSQRRAMTPRIAPQAEAAHSRAQPGLRRRGPSNPAQDPLYRAAPERWLESVLRETLAPLTRGLAPQPSAAQGKRVPDANDDDNIGNRFTPAPRELAWQARAERDRRIIPHFDARWVYSQVPAIAGAGDRGMLDLLGVTADGRLAVLELKASEDMHFALQGLDYWIRVRAQHRLPVDMQSGVGEFQRHGYFPGAQLSPENPRLFLVAPALHVHPATEIVLRYLSPQVEWQLLAVDERWRENVRVVWRRSSASSSSSVR